MHIVHFKKKHTSEYGKLEADYITPFVSGKDPYNCGLLDIDFVENEKKEQTAFELLAPVKPSKIIGVALNYRGVSKESHTDTEPLIFLKGNNSITTANSKVELPKDQKTWGESELAVVIKKKGKNINSLNASDYILGFTSSNDITSHNINGRDHHLARSKSVDGFCPVGRYIDTEFSYENRNIRAYQNNILIREGNTCDMIFNVNRIIEFVSKSMTLMPGDLIITGAPLRVREKMYLAPDDTYKICIEGMEDLVTRFF